MFEESISECFKIQWRDPVALLSEERLATRKVFNTFIVRECDPSTRKEGNMATVSGSDPYVGVEGTSTGVTGDFIPPPLASAA